MREDPGATLSFLKSIGYQDLEYPGTSRRRAKKIIRDIGLVSLACDDCTAAIQKNGDSMLAEYKMNSIRNTCFSIGRGWVMGGNKTIAGWKRNCDMFSKLGKLRKSAGITLAYCSIGKIPIQLWWCSK
ncbi:MAG: hypothetical protein ABIS36_10345 [Chryseolinea sp.]